MVDSPLRSLAGSSLRAVRWCGLAACCALAAPNSVPAAAPRAGPSPIPLTLRWELAPAAGAADTASGARAADTHALLTLANRGSEAWPAHGWALYFNCLSGVRSGADGSFELQQLVGTWYRLRPTRAFAGLAPGASVTLRIEHGERPFNASKAPVGPYVVLDRAPAVGRPLREYRAVPPTATASAAETDTAEAEALYRRYLGTVTLPAEEVPLVFPTPQRVQRLPGSVHWSALPRIEATADLTSEVALAREYLRPYLSADTVQAGALPLRLRVAALAGQTSPEAYELDVEPAGDVLITGQSPAGVARGLASLRELLPPRLAPPDGVDLPAIRVADAPRFAYRGLLLDVARNFEPKAVVLRAIDAMARSKLNVLHLHLADDEGWRLPIDGLPELTTVGARRGHTLDSAQFLPPAYGSGPALDDAHGSGHFSHADYIAILRYAAARHVEVIPEIEMPGHARAAVMAMEARARAGDARYRLADPQDTSQYRSAQQYTDNVMNPGLESTYAFIGQVVTQVAALHRAAGVPLRTLHVGADELPRGAWQASPAVRALMQRERLRSRDAVWEYFYGRIAAILDRHGVALAGWEELGAQRRADGQLVPNPHFLGRGATLYVWNNIDGAEDLGNRLANAGYDTVFAPATRLYLDMAYVASPAEPGTNWAAYTDLDDVYDYEPFDAIRRAASDPAPLEGREALDVAARARVRGIEATLFSETVRDAARLEYLLVPRLLAVAERGWAPQPEWARAADAASAAALHAAAWSVFANQLGQRVLPRLDAERSGIAYRIAPPGLHRAADGIHVNQQLPGFALRYTLDGREPDAHSAVVNGPITQTGDIRVAAFDRDGRPGRSSHVDRAH
ncbi:MAG: carbohydate-binding domain-containing protein [Proteobacteria bacterium]|nr:carbohydate-binding domain-containing protein [Pseudomonadota bacterium]